MGHARQAVKMPKMLLGLSMNAAMLGRRSVVLRYVGASMAQPGHAGGPPLFAGGWKSSPSKKGQASRSARILPVVLHADRRTSAPESHTQSLSQ